MAGHNSSSANRTVRTVRLVSPSLLRFPSAGYVVTNKRGVQVRASLERQCTTAMAVVKIALQDHVRAHHRCTQPIVRTQVAQRRIGVRYGGVGVVVWDSRHGT